MSWKKYFRVANLNTGSISPISGQNGNNITYRNYQSNLPDVYIGHPNRVERYNQYEQMDMDSEVNAALDILSEFSTQINEENGTAFRFVWKEKPTDNEIKIIKEQLIQWVSLNELNKRIFKIFRNTIKYGDQVFLRDPETFKLFWVEMSKVVKVIVNEAEGKKPEQYILKELAPNFENLTATALNSSDVSVNHPQVGGPNGAYIQPKNPYSGGSRFSKAQNEAAVNAEHIVHLSLTEGLDFSWPFGNSVLENVFKVFKQKELLEDAIIIYRIQRAPERRIFYIDVGNMPSHMAMAFVERVKNEVHQRRIPTQTGGGQNMMDATYAPLSVNEDYFFPQTAEGRGSKVETLPGGCLSMDTQIDLLDGRTLTLSELTEEYKLGKNNWTFSTNPKTGEIVPGLISWAGVTHKSAKVLKIVLDNGKEIIATPDHKFPILGKESLRADELCVGSELMSHKQDSSIAGTISISEIIELEEPITVGTLTIDVDEIYHSYHNFALSAGVFTNNSNLGEITDLHFFTNKLFRGLRIPASYLPTGLDDGTSNQNTFSDGRVGTALIQEWRFNQYCIRLQRSVAEKLDQEFKMFMRWRGINIDGSLFELQFNEPQNFASYRQAEVDSARITSFTQLEQFPYLSKRFLLTRFLGLTEEEISENEKLWNQEQGDTKEAKAEQVGLRGVGISPGGLDMGIEAADMVAAPPGGEVPLGGGGELGGAPAATPSPLGGGGAGAAPPL